MHAAVGGISARSLQNGFPTKFSLSITMSQRLFRSGAGKECF